MRLEAGNFNSEVSPIPTITRNYNSTTSASVTVVSWSENLVPPAVTFTDLDVPVGSVIGIMLYTYIARYGQCLKREANPSTSYAYFTATQSYASILDWWNANYSAIMASLTTLTSGGQVSLAFMGFYNQSTSSMYTLATNQATRDGMRLYINRDPSNQQLQFL